jgi:hypothetical protein
MVIVLIGTSEVELTPRGKELLEAYSDMLSKLKAQIAASVPAVDEQKRAAFLAARTARDRVQPPKEGDTPDVVARNKQMKEEADADALKAARAVLADVTGFLAGDALDPQLVRCSLIANAAPRGLAEFAQKGEKEKALVDRLLGDDELMKRMLVAGGANGYEYGEAMQVYTAILEASERAREPGILQRLALGTALHQPWLKGEEKGGVHGIVYTDNSVPDGQVSRYLHYEKAYLDDELDPAFKDMNAWECRFITNDPYTNEELAWVREMTRNYRPDHMRNPDYKWRYALIVKSDVPYASPTWDPKLGTKTQQMICGGGKCGPRAFFGRFVTRAFGIPSRRSTQSGHAAMNHWTPDGWVVCFGAWWSMNWCGPWGGLDFLLDSQAREHPEDYMHVLRAQWIGDALGEADVGIRNGQYGKGAGLWDGLAFYKKRAVVEDAEIAEVGKELAKLSADEARLLGESDNVLDKKEQKPTIQIPKEYRETVVGKDGVITIPASACSKPTDNTDKIKFMESWDGGWQIHYQRLGQRPDLLKYYVGVPAAGEYELTARVATVSVNQQAILRLNRRTLVDIPLPYTKGMWEETEPVTIALKEGRNTLMFTCRAPNRGVSIKHFTLTPVGE